MTTCKADTSNFLASSTAHFREAAVARQCMVYVFQGCCTQTRHFGLLSIRAHPLLGPHRLSCLVEPLKATRALTRSTLTVAVR
mmetsp:Transcript_53537/g.143213  ORF Transcript_53537/g.143213 Transcript_53537/m.143213 type:complete len:83 (-) Transcript_53537:14-262(-)